MINLIIKKDNKFQKLNCWEDDSITVNHLKSLPNNINRSIVYDFLRTKFLYSYNCKKRLMQALRNCDEIGICNELCEALEELPTCDLFFILNEDTILSDLVIKNLEEIYSEKDN